MSLTDREQEIIDLLRREPLISPAEIAARLGSTRAADVRTGVTLANGRADWEEGARRETDAGN